MLRDVSVGRKLTLIITLTSSATLLVACVAVAMYEVHGYRQAIADDSATMGAVLGENSAAALVFGDANAGEGVLKALRAEPRVVVACLYLKGNVPFARYVRAGERSDWPTPPIQDGIYFTSERLIEYRHIKLEGEVLGSIYIESDLQELNLRLRHYVGLVALVMLLSSLVAFLLASRLQRLISRPILDLLKTTKLISAENNYALRARGRGADELGLLVAGFNGMLDQIQKRDIELECRRADLQMEVAARTEMNQRLETAKEAAEAASRTKGEFLANMSHEIRTPINGILGMTELALDTQLTAEQQDYLLMVRSSGESLMGVINDILDFSKIELGKLSLERIEFNLYHCIGETMKGLALRAHQKGLELIYDVRPEVPAVLIGDPGRLRQVLQNLVGNALKFTSNGEVMLLVESAGGQEGDEVQLHFSVRDTGIGVAPDKQQLIFQAFSQADSSTTRHYGGTGLGLSISSLLVEMMGGRIWLESALGKGSTFHFTTKFSPVATLEESAGDPTPEADLQGMPALIVDDNATNRRILLETTRRWGMLPTAVESGPAALTEMEAAIRSGRPYRVLLIDSRMPTMDGFQLAEKIRDTGHGPQATILMLTSAGQRGEAERCRAAGIAAYLLKPIPKADLHSAILRVLRPPKAAPVTPGLVTRHTLRESPNKLRVLVAEDNEVNQALIMRVLQRMGHAAVLARNGQEALALATTQEFDVVFMDVQMPEMDGLAATRAIREIEKKGTTRVPIFAMTAHAMKGDREICLEAGMDGYLTKPMRFSDIQETLASLHNTGQPQNRPAASATMKATSWSKAEVLERLGGDEELFGELCEIFFRESPKLLKTLREAIERGDADAVHRAAHSLKGEASYLGGGMATQTARQLEEMAGRRDLSRASELLAALERELEGLLHAIGQPVGDLS